MALSPNEKRLYVACAGINAVAVVETDQMQLLGFIPTGWFPARVALSADGKTLFVANAKGFGAGPNGGKGFQPGPEGAYIGDITKGTVSILTVPKDYQLRPLTLQVMRNNGFVPGFLAQGTKPGPQRPPDFPVPLPGSPSSKIHHVVFITKENRTFDEVLGDLGGAGADRDATLARWGMDATVKEEKVPAPTLEHVQVTPNEHALAKRFAFSDNFYVDSDVSVDGHHWLVGNYPNELLESAWPAGYGGKLDFVPDQDAPGRLDIGASPQSPRPTSKTARCGRTWRAPTSTFRNYGEGMELPGDDESTGEYPTGSRQAVNVPMPKVLFDNTSRDFPTFNTNISDQYRFAQFKKEFDEFVSGKKPMPQFIYIWLPNDHTSDPRPEDGYAYRASYVADNDSGAGQAGGVVLAQPVLERHGHLRDRRRRAGRPGPRGRAPQPAAGDQPLRQARRLPRPHQHGEHHQNHQPDSGHAFHQSVRRRGHRPLRHVHQHSRLHPLRRAAFRHAHLRPGQSEGAGPRRPSPANLWTILT